MPTRTPPSPEQIAEILRRAFVDLDERIVPWDIAERTLRQVLRTTKVNAEAWLYSAVLDSDDLWMTYVRDGGAMHGVLTRNDGKSLKGPYVIDVLTKYGFTGDPGWSHVDEGGRYIADPKAREDLPRSKNGLPFVGTRKGIQYLLDQESLDLQGRLAAMGAEDVVRNAAFENEHGNAADYLRGLLHAAGITEDGRFAEVQTYAGGGRPGDQPFTSVELRVTGTGVDLLAAVLQRLGIQPTPKE